ncbi:centrosomal protein of 112 kDa [Anomaloglossus baeobatrachus]|uniref:centrosomal protein of 112 kDa n=1 Tax=Anomaloglossus baeobatrachus TaxID=238106 RepID=UPI003F4F4394
MLRTQEGAWETLDAEFDHYLVDMKPHVLKLPQRRERQRCALWIKKLCDPSGAGSGITGRKNRNLYAKLLLHMLQRGVLEGPFTHKPEDGTLRTLPTYMSIYFDEPLSPRFLGAGSGELPDWVRGELEAKSEESPRAEPAPVMSPDRPQYSHSRALAMSPSHRSQEDALRTEGKRLPANHDDSDLDAVLHSWNLGIENPRYLRDKPLSPISPDSRLGRSADVTEERRLSTLHMKEMEGKMKGLEAKHQEEKLKMQQKHDADVQKILERKNNELEEMKNLYRTKQEEAEETVRRLEKKVQTVLRESQLIRETKEAQIQELRKLCEESADSLRLQWEKKLHSAVADMEQEKFDLQKRHTENIQELLDDTNTRLLKMEDDYVSQTKATAQTVKELEARVQQLTVEAESSSLQRQKLSQERTELEASWQASCSEVQQLSARLAATQKEQDRLSRDHDQQLQQLHGKYQSDVDYITQQSALAAAKASALIEELEQSLSRSKQQGQEREHQLQQDLREQESGFQREKLQTERQWEKKVHDLLKKLDEEKETAAKKLSKMADVQRETEEQLRQVTGVQRLQAEATDEFKRQVERNTEKAYGEMREQMEKVESDLNRSKSLREKQSLEFSRQLQEVTERSEQQMVELRLEQEQEKIRLHQEHSAERDRLVREHEQEIQRLERQLQGAMTEHEHKAQAWRERDAQLLQDEVSGYCARLRVLERRLQDKDLQLQEQITHVRQEYELKIRGLMPAAMRHELEDTITSLKSQVGFLQKRAQVLQDDLSIHQSRRL